MCNNYWHRILTAFCLVGVVMAADSALAFYPGFKARLDYGVGREPRFLVSSDLDGDGDIDLAVPNYWSDNVSVLLNNGDGTFQAAVDYEVGREPYFLVSSDLDGDGDIDLAVTNYYSLNVSVLLNNGDGTFQTAVNYGVGREPRFLVSSDLDGDGDIDLAVPNYWSNNVSVLLNNGDGTFRTAVNYEVGRGPYFLVSSDLDGDGDIDLAVTSTEGDNVSVLENLTYTGIREEEVSFSSLPASPVLYQNYPNPFNPQTTIRYALPKDVQVRLVVYNVAGQEIEMLVNEEQQAGYYECVWDGKDVASGIYFYRLQAGDFVQTRKMVLIR